MSSSESLKESMLYPYVKQWLLDRCCLVQAEVKDIDVAALYRAEGGEELFIAVELKTRISLELLLQAVDRLDVADLVYIAVPLTGNLERIELVKKLCRRLGIGMLVVNLRSTAPVAEQIVAPKNNTVDLQIGSAEPLPPPDERTESVERLGDRIERSREQDARSGAASRKKSSSRARAAAVREFLRRRTDVNTGGSSKKPLMTAYREESLRILYHMASSGATTTKALKALGIKASGRVLSANYYGWFVAERKAKNGGEAHYAVSERGREALAEYADVVAFLVQKQKNP